MKLIWSPSGTITVSYHTKSTGFLYIDCLPPGWGRNLKWPSLGGNKLCWNVLRISLRDIFARGQNHPIRSCPLWSLPGSHFLNYVTTINVCHHREYSLIGSNCLITNGGFRSWAFGRCWWTVWFFMAVSSWRKRWLRAVHSRIDLKIDWSFHIKSSRHSYPTVSALTGLGPAELLLDSEILNVAWLVGARPWLSYPD